MHWSFESEDAAGALCARTDLLDYLRARAEPGSDVDAAILVFGELVGNVVRHAPGPISIVLEWDDGVAVLRVLDQGPGFDFSVAVKPDVLAESGRGLFIVSQVSERFEIRRRSDGMEAKARLPVRRRRAPE